MNDVCLPLWQAIAWALGIGVGVGFLAAAFGAYYGAKLAIKMCAKQNGCPMRIEEENAKTTQDLEKQLQALHLKRPELIRARKAMDAILDGTGDHPAVLDRRSQHDKDRDGHK